MSFYPFLSSNSTSFVKVGHVVGLHLAVLNKWNDVWCRLNNFLLCSRLFSFDKILRFSLASSYVVISGFDVWNSIEYCPHTTRSQDVRAALDGCFHYPIHCKSKCDILVCNRWNTCDDEMSHAAQYNYMLSGSWLCLGMGCTKHTMLKMQLRQMIGDHLIMQHLVA